jgi:hypothetical protein
VDEEWAGEEDKNENPRLRMNFFHDAGIEGKTLGAIFNMANLWMNVEFINGGGFIQCLQEEMMNCSPLILIRRVYSIHLFLVKLFWKMNLTRWRMSSRFLTYI